jgi:hypothetical protein
MRFKLGDFVRFVDERREGYVTRVIDEHTIGVTGDDDFEIPVLESQVTMVHGDHSEAQGQDSRTRQPVKTESFIEKGVFLAVVSDARTASVVHFHLLNTTSWDLLAVCNSEKTDSVKGEYASIVDPVSTVKIYSASLTELSSWPKIQLQILFYGTQLHKAKQPLVFAEKFNAKDFSGAKKNAPLLNQPAWLFQLDETEVLIDAEKLKESFFKSPEEKTGIARPQTEIDLHIERLADDHQFLTSSEMLSIQLTELRKNIDAAIAHKFPSIVFIHGVGNGTLKHEIHKVVSKHPQVKTFMDARKEKFGYGATEVWFKF